MMSSSGLRAFTLLGIATALVLIFVTAQSGTVRSDSALPEGVFRITGTMPAWLLAPELEINCLSRREGSGTSVVIREVCYRGTTIDPAATPGPPPYLGDIPEFTFEHEVLTGTYTSATNQLVLSGLPCTAVIAGALYVSLDLSFDIDGGTETGSAVITTDTTNPYTCQDGTETTGTLTMTPLGLGHDEDGDGCTDWEELGPNVPTGPLDPFNISDCDPLTDTDGDGCTDFAELGSDVTEGGQRNPLDPWDFYDVASMGRRC